MVSNYSCDHSMTAHSALCHVSVNHDNDHHVSVNHDNYHHAGDYNDLPPILT